MRSGGTEMVSAYAVMSYAVYFYDYLCQGVCDGIQPVVSYYVENNHPVIIERAMFDRVQEELARRSSKRKVKQAGTKTELGKCSGKYALSELLFCGCCGTPYSPPQLRRR